MKLASKVAATLLFGAFVALGGAQAASAAAADFSGVVGCSSSGGGVWSCHDQNGNLWYTDNPDWRP